VSNNIPDTEYNLYLWLKAYFIPDLQLCTNKKSRYDCYSEKFNIDIELKCRRVHYDKLVIEKYKYDALINRSKKEGTIPLYINSTPKGIYAFYLQSIQIDWELKLMPKQTFFKEKQNVLKVVGYLDIETSVDLIDLKNKMKDK
jgi:hypothetical protein